jgi:hypothetical protein
MSRYNRFGKVYTDVIACYPGTVVADYDGGGASGQTRVEEAMDRATLEVAASLTPAVYKALTDVEAQEVVSYATAGQSSFTLGMVPVVAGSVHLWIYPLTPPAGADWNGGEWNSDAWYKPPTVGFNEVETTDYSVTEATGAISYTGPTIGLGQRVFASYRVDVDNASFSSLMLGQIAVLGAAAELGERLYSSATQEWALVTQYRTRYNDLLKQLKDGALIPDEVRKLKYFTEVERTNNEIRSVRFLRG